MEDAVEGRRELFAEINSSLSCAGSNDERYKVSILNNVANQCAIDVGDAMADGRDGESGRNDTNWKQNERICWRSR